MHEREAKCIQEPSNNISDNRITNLSTKIPARMAWATLLNLSLSSPWRLDVLVRVRVNVSVNQSRTSLGTPSGSTTPSTSSSTPSVSLLKQQYVVVSNNSWTDTMWHRSRWVISVSSLAYNVMSVSVKIFSRRGTREGDFNQNWWVVFN